MATSKENDLIGYDPLAWMDGDIDQDENGEDHLVMDSVDFDNQTSISANNSDDFRLNIQENDTLDVTEEAESTKATFEDATDVALVSEGVNVSASEEVEGPLIDLDATLTIQNVVKLYEKLKRLLALHDQIEINASDVSSIDTATLQLLVSLKKDVVKLHKKVTIIYPSPRFVESAKLLGLLDILDVHEL
ncbi:MAG: STAS domain-containing protein [Methylobacter sp.]|nr:STAS domain-containing protein [Methylobacter sp.]